MMCKMLFLVISLLLFISPAFGQVTDDIESDTLYMIEARSMVRYNLNDYGSNTIWPDSVINNWLNQSCWEIASQGVIVKRDTLKTADSLMWYLLNDDFMRVKNVFIKHSIDSRWYELQAQIDSVPLPEIIKRDTIITAADSSWYPLNTDFIRIKDVLIKYTEDDRWRSLRLQGDSASIIEPEVVKFDTIITTASTVWYSLNTDIMRVREVMVKDEGDRWKGLKPKGASVWARDSDIGINTYEIDGDFLRIDRPSSQSGDSIVVVYNPYYQGVKGYDIDGNYLCIDKTPTDSGDSLVLVYYAYIEGVKDYYDIDGKYLHLDLSLDDVGDSLIVVYFAYANDLTDSVGFGCKDSIIINLPYEYQMQVIQGAVGRARMSNREK